MKDTKISGNDSSRHDRGRVLTLVLFAICAALVTLDLYQSFESLLVLSRALGGRIRGTT